MVWGRTGGVSPGHGGLGRGKVLKQRRGLQSNLPEFFSSQTEVTSQNLFEQLKHFVSRSKSPTLGLTLVGQGSYGGAHWRHLVESGSMT